MSMGPMAAAAGRVTDRRKAVKYNYPDGSVSVWITKSVQISKQILVIR